MVSATGTRFGPDWFTPCHHISSLRTLLRQVPHIYASKSGQGKNGQTLTTRSYLPSVCVSAFPLEVGSEKEWTGLPHIELPAICVCVCISTRSRVRERMDRPSPHRATCHLCVCLHFHSKSGQRKNGQVLPTRSYLPSVSLYSFPTILGWGNACTMYV
jgi:hypothetical protein